jgi:hypothetical protein
MSVYNAERVYGNKRAEGVRTGARDQVSGAALTTRFRPARLAW